MHVEWELSESYTDKPRQGTTEIRGSEVKECEVDVRQIEWFWYT